MFDKQLLLATLATGIVVALAPAPAAAAPVILNPTFELIDAATNLVNNSGSFFIENWNPTGFATSSINDPSQFDNGLDLNGSSSVVGFISGAGISLNQVVQGFVVGESYRLTVTVNARSNATPTFTALVDGVAVIAPTTLGSVDPAGVFATAFVPLVSDTFIATNTFLTVSLANTSGSNQNGSTLLGFASITGVPEPITLAILGVGLAGVGLARRRRG